MSDSKPTTIKEDGIIRPPHAPGCYPGNDPHGIATGINAKPNPADESRHQSNNSTRMSGSHETVGNEYKDDAEEPGCYPGNFPTPHGSLPRNQA